MLWDKAWNGLMIRRKRVKCGKGTLINGRLYIHGIPDAITIGNDCVINSSEIYNPTSGFNHSHFTVGAPGKIIIGNNVGMSHVNITSVNSITICDNVFIGSGVKIWDTDFHPVHYEQRIKRTPPNTSPVIIGEGAFIGACSIILKGVSIGKHSVIGAGSVVTKDVPDNEVWAGNPAEFIKMIDD